MRLTALGFVIFALALSANAQAPAAPTLSSPANNATGVSNSPTLVWNASTGATSYRLQLASDSLFTNVVLDDSSLTGTSTTLGALPNNTLFYWHVSARNTSGTSAYSAARRFTTVPLPPIAPVLGVPAPGAVNVATTSTLSWAASAGAATYRVQISTDSNFATTVLNDSTVTATSRTTGSLTINTVYYWRINAKNLGGTSAFSAFRSFTTSAVAVPATPVLVSPASNATAVQVSLNLIWRTTAGATSYTVQLSTDSTFATALINDSVATDTVKAAASLSTNTAYFWRVRAQNAGGTSAFTTTRRFTTISVVPTTPTLTAPANNATNVALSSNLTWGAATGATTYRIQVSTDSSFATSLIDDSTLTASPKAVGPLPNNTLYYWHVNARNVFGTSAYSTRRSFRTVPVAPAAPVLNTPVANATSVPTSGSLTWTASTGAVTYRVQLSIDSTFATTTLNDSTVTATTRAANNLTINTVYYWRVNAKNGGGTSAFSATQKFTTASAVLPTTPTLSSPANNATMVSASPTLIWRTTTGATSYQLQVSADSTFTTNFYNDSTITDTTRAVAGLTSGGAAYYWHVRAKNAGGTSAYSTRRRFTTTNVLPIVGRVTLKQLSLENGRAFEFNLPAKARVEITLFDSQGKTRFKLLDEVRDAGYYNIPMPAGLSGTYTLLDFRTEGFHKTLKISP